MFLVRPGAPSPPETLKVHLKKQKLKGAMLEMLENQHEKFSEGIEKVGSISFG